MSDSCPFAILGLVPSWPVEPSAVHRARLSAAARFHPDRAVDAIEREAFQQRMAAANQAAGNLLDPVLAAGAVLRAAGVDAGELALPPMELAELLERREWYDERLAGDAASRAEAEAWHVAERGRLIAEFALALGQGRSTPDWNEARRGIARLRALSRMTDRTGAQQG